MSKLVSLPGELTAFITEKVVSGRYGSASEVVRVALLSLEDKAFVLPFQRGQEVPGVS